MEPACINTNTHSGRLIETFRNVPAAAHLSWIRPLHSLHGDALSCPPRVPLLRHPLAVRSKGPHSRSPSLVQAHGRPAHVRVVHGGRHACWIHPSGGASWPWLVHELVVVGLSGAHLERRAHLQTKCEVSDSNRITFGFCSDFVSRRQLYLSILVHVLVLGFLQSCNRGRCCGRRSSCGGSNSSRCSGGSWLSEVTGGTCVRGQSHPTRWGIWTSRITNKKKQPCC